MAKNEQILKRLILLDQLDDLDSAFGYETPLISLNVNKSIKNGGTSEKSVAKRKRIDETIQERTEPDKNHPTRYLHDAENPLEHHNNNEFHSIYGFRKETVNDIYHMIDYGFNQKTRRGNPKNSMQSLLLTLRFLKTGTFATNNTEFISQSTTSRISKKITGLLAELRSRFIKIPEASSSKAIAEKFRELGGFPDVFACIGSTHIAIKTPSKSVADDYLNEDNYYSFRLFGCSGPNLEFYEIISRWPGASHENKIFNLSEMYQRFEFTTKMDGVLLANERYSCTNFVMTPIEVCGESNHDNLDKYQRYNEAHKKTYTFCDAVEVLKGRFRCLQNVLAVHDGK